MNCINKLLKSWGIYDVTTDPKFRTFTSIKAADVSGPGYHWYKLRDTILTPHAYVHFFWSWFVQNPLENTYDAAAPNAKYDIWASVKFAGTAFPFGNAEDKIVFPWNALWWCENDDEKSTFNNSSFADDPGYGTR